MQSFIQSLSKAELHIHIEGSLEPQMMMDLAKRNRIALKYGSVEQIKKAYQFGNLQDFLDLYYQGMSVLRTEQDFYDLSYAYLAKASEQNVKQAEIFFDPQGHLVRGVDYATFMPAFAQAAQDAKSNLGIDAKYILCFLRHLPEKDAMQAFEKALDYKDLFIGVGLDSSELGFPPSLFKNVFKEAKDEGLYLVAHAGEEGPAEYVWEALDVLGIDRVDHGNNAIHDQELINRLVKDQIPLTMCPLSNQRLQVVPDLTKHQLRAFLNAGVVATLNSDDPAYFGGHINENYLAMANALDLNEEELSLLASNSFKASFTIR